MILALLEIEVSGIFYLVGNILVVVIDILWLICPCTNRCTVIWTLTASKPLVNFCQPSSLSNANTLQHVFQFLFIITSLLHAVGFILHPAYFGGSKASIGFILWDIGLSFWDKLCLLPDRAIPCESFHVKISSTFLNQAIFEWFVKHFIWFYNFKHFNG